MADEDFVYIDASEIVASSRGGKRKPKYQHRVWEADDEKDKARYALMMSSINMRRQVMKDGYYDEENDPYAPLISTRYRYEIECETVFHSDEEIVEEAVAEQNVCNVDAYAAAIFFDLVDDVLMIDDQHIELMDEFESLVTPGMVKQIEDIISEYLSSCSCDLCKMAVQDVRNEYAWVWKNGSGS